MHLLVDVLVVVEDRHTLLAVVGIPHREVHCNFVAVAGNLEVDSLRMVDSLLEVELGCIDEQLDCVDPSEDHNLAEESLKTF